MMRFIETLYADPLLKFLIGTTMKGVVIFAVAGVFAFCLRHRSAAMRGFVWSMAIVGCLIIPLLSLVLPKWELGILPAEAPVSIAQSQLSPRPVSSTPITLTPPQPNFVTDQSGTLTTLHWSDWIAIVWAGAGLFLLIRLIVGIGAVWHISVRGSNFSRAAEQFQANVRLSNRIKVPMVWGFLRPVILLPVDANHWQTERLRAVLLHELAHIKRWDWTMQMVAHVACAVYWFNPIVWCVARWMRIEAEQACDDHVLNAGYRSTDYAQHLLDITRNVKIAKATSSAAVAIARSSKIEGRLRTVLAENLNRHPVTKVAAGIGLLVFICFTVPMGAIRLAQAVNPGEVLSQHVQEVSKSEATSEELPSKSEAYPQDASLKQSQKNVEICTQNLLAIGKAIQAYQKEHSDFPGWLSELHPKYLSDASILLCPADTKGGKPVFLINADPKMPVSYGYQFHPEYREGKSKQRLVYGDAMPLVRCRHHANEDFTCLNLSFSSKIYKSANVWESAPEVLYGSHEAAITAFEETLERHPDDPRFFEIYPRLVRLYTQVGNQQSANAIIERLKSYKTTDIDYYRMLFDVLVGTERYEEMLEIFKTAEKQNPNAQPIHARLAYIYKKLGNTELAEVYERKADPKYELWGKLVPDFSATDLDGNSISLQDYRGKIVLLDFWAVWCGPCIAEMPNLKRVYATYKEQGFDIIGVSLDNEEPKLTDYLKENDIQWRQIFDNARGEDSLVRQYGIRGIPAPWLIDRDGTLISHKARGEDLERLVVQALKDKSVNQ